MLHTSAGQLVVNDLLPEELRDYNRVLDRKGTQQLLQTVAEKYPDKYRDIAHGLSKIGYQSSYYTGGQSFDHTHLRPAVSGLKMRNEILRKVEQIYADPNLDDEAKEHKVVEETLKYTKLMEDAIFKESTTENNPLAHQIISGARGNPSNLKSNLKSLRGSDLLYVDHKDNPIPIPVLHSYSEGLRPVEYYAGTFGARKGTMSAKFATQDAGALSKQFNQVAHRLIVTKHDHDDSNAHANQGLPVDLDDPDNEGALLAFPVGGYPRNTILRPKIISHLNSLGVKRIVVRSPITTGPIDGGLYGRDVGVRERGGISPQGDNIGIAAAQALCIAKDTMVQMADGTSKPIQMIEAGDWVLGCSRRGEVKPVKVLWRYDNGYRECYETIFRRGTGESNDDNLLRLVSTLDHKLLAVVTTEHGRRRDELRPAAIIIPVQRPTGRRDRFYAKLSTSYDDSTGHIDEPFALALGLLIGDGCYTGGVSSNGIGLSCYDPLLIADVSKYFHQLGCRLVPQSTDGGFRVSSLDGGKQRSGQLITAVRNPVRKKLLELGMWGQYSFQKVLPPTHNWTNNSVAQLLAGLLATDGYTHVGRRGRVAVGFTSTSLELILSVRQLLAVRFGVQTSSPIASRKARPDGNGYYRACYAITVNSYEGVQRLHECISIPGVKGRALQTAVDNWMHGPKSAERGRCGFVSQIHVGQLETFDIEVDHPDHLFMLANKLIVSNSEPLTQIQLGGKHFGGVAGASSGIGGFKLINQLTQVPKTFKGGAAHAQLDGRVGDIEAAPQGGHYITVGGQRHYVHTDYEPLVKRGDEVEAGDVISDGIPNPAEIVRHKGIGEGRRYFVNSFRQAYRDSGLPHHRRNIEIMARGLIDHVKLTEEHGHYVPGDVVPYSRLEHTYQPREGHQIVEPKRAVGMYMEKPVLHYSIGTKIRPSTLNDLHEFGVNKIVVHKDPPPFEPEMIRGMENLSHDPDWMVRFLGSYQKKNLLRGVHRGDVSDEKGTSYVPALARAADFGKVGPVKPWQPSSIFKS